MNYYNCIYMYINKINNKKYIGQAKNFNNRHNRHINGKSQLIDIKIQEYGIDNFDIKILKSNIKTQCTMNLFECYYIEKYNTLVKNNNGYNVASGGHNGNVFIGKTNEEMNDIKDKISKSWSNNYDIRRKKISETMIKNESQKGVNNSMYGKKHRKDTIEKMRNKAMGRSFSEESREKMKKASLGKNNPNSSPVYQCDKNGNIIKEWSYINEASVCLGIDKTSISRCCTFHDMDFDKELWFSKYNKNPQKFAGGFMWKYKK